MEAKNILNHFTSKRSLTDALGAGHSLKIFAQFGIVKGAIAIRFAFIAVEFHIFLNLLDEYISLIS